MNTCKTITIFACTIIAVAFAAAVFHWYATGFTSEGLDTILSFARTFIPAILAFIAKEAYEGKEKITCDHIEKMNKLKGGGTPCAKPFSS